MTGDVAQRARDDDRRVRALDAFLVEYEEEHRPITEDDIDRAQRWARERVIVVRGGVVHRPTAT